MKTREQIINSMCHTWRHDYGLVKETNTHPHEAGMTQSQRDVLWRQMAQLFDNDILPVFKENGIKI